MEIGEIKEIKVGNLSFEVQAMTLPFYTVNKKLEYEKIQYGIVVSDIKKNKYGMVRGSMVLIPYNI